MRSNQPRPGRRRRLIIWAVVLFVLLVPLPAGDGLWLPLLFQLFEAMNSELPANF